MAKFCLQIPTNCSAVGKNLCLLLINPCVYREHDGVIRSNDRYFGLSLCIQGTLFFLASLKTGLRFIPVYTGNINKDLLGVQLRTVYPCVYREHAHHQGIKIHPIRFIPVYTGNIFSYACLLIVSAVYPCVYREHRIVQSCKLKIRGLSLCIQGTLISCTEGSIIFRFIPVYTGNIE